MSSTGVLASNAYPVSPMDETGILKVLMDSYLSRRRDAGSSVPNTRYRLQLPCPGFPVRLNFRILSLTVYPAYIAGKSPSKSPLSQSLYQTDPRRSIPDGFESVLLSFLELYARSRLSGIQRCQGVRTMRKPRQYGVLSGSRLSRHAVRQFAVSRNAPPRNTFVLPVTRPTRSTRTYDRGPPQI